MALILLWRDGVCALISLFVVEGHRRDRLQRCLSLKVVPIGNSRGMRLPRELLTRYHIRDTILLEVREEGLLLKGAGDDRLSWEETYRQAACERENWSDLDGTLLDGIAEEK